MAARAHIPDAAPQRVTLDEFYAITGDRRAEVVDGVIVYLDLDLERDAVTGASLRHGSVTTRLAAALGAHVYPGGLGELFDGSTGFVLRRSPPLVRCPDVGFVRAERLPGGVPPGPLELAPDLAVEVLSPSNTAAEMTRKLADYFGHGTRIVWLVDPDAREVTVYSAGAIPRLLHDTDTLDGGDVLPGFSTPVAALFAGLAPRA
jgi:Uma2 family endonuclease